MRICFGSKRLGHTIVGQLSRPSTDSKSKNNASLTITSYVFEVRGQKYWKYRIEFVIWRPLTFTINESCNT